MKTKLKMNRTELKTKKSKCNWIKNYVENPKL